MKLSIYTKKHILHFLLLFPFVTFAQQKLCRTDILNGLEAKDEKNINKYLEYNFSSLWITPKDQNIVYGIIGDNYQRIDIKLVQVEKNILSPQEYFVYGISTVRNNKTSFVGKIKIDSIQKIVSANFGVDDSYKDSEIKYQGLINAKYSFFEDRENPTSGYFEGKLQTLFYIDKDNKVRYNDINSYSDGYFNNAFVGLWKKYSSNLTKICNWGDFRVPYTKCDFDVGAGEFSVSDKYKCNDWYNY